MSSDESSRRGAHDLAAHLQPDEGDVYGWADTAEERARAARIDRLAGDRDLIGELRRRGFAGPEYQRTAEELVRYGVGVLTAWIARGTVFDKCAKKGRAVERPPAGALDLIEAESMAGEVITVALAHFRTDVLLPGRWDPARGASLTTFFVGQCILRFPNIYRSWLAQVPEYTLDEATARDERRNPVDSVEDDVIRDRMTAEALRLVRSDDARRALVLVGYGYTQPQIARRLGKTEKAVERMLDYARKQVKKGQRSA